jgi:hypothetical protein
MDEATNPAETAYQGEQGTIAPDPYAGIGPSGRAIEQGTAVPGHGEGRSAAVPDEAPLPSATRSGASLGGVCGLPGAGRALHVCR